MAGFVGKCAGAVGLCLLAATVGPAADPPARAVVAQSTSAAGTFTARPAGADAFTVLPENAELHSGDLHVTLPGASARAKNGAVTLKSLADYDGKSPLPILETAVIFHEPKDADFDVTLDRGRIDLTNTKDAGAAVARVRFWDQTWKITLAEPGDRVALELVGRWPPGARFKVATADADEPKPTPAASLVLLVLKGEAAVDVGGVTLGMKAPPGPALVEWDSISGARPQPLKLEKMPDWADPETPLTDDGKKAAAAVEKFRQARLDNPAGATATFVGSDDPIEVRVGLVTAGAADDVETLGKAVTAAKSPGEWDFGVTAFRHWLGRCPGHDQRLYEYLTSPARGYTPAQAKVILQLLFGFSADDLGQPETYEVLIDYLSYDQAAIRNLAEWHLVRIVPEGKGIPFKPSGTKAECEKTHQEWKKLIPAGQLPPAPKKD